MWRFTSWGTSTTIAAANTAGDYLTWSVTAGARTSASVTGLTGISFKNSLNATSIDLYSSPDNWTTSTLVGKIDGSGITGTNNSSATNNSTFHTGNQSFFTTPLTLSPGSTTQFRMFVNNASNTSNYIGFDSSLNWSLEGTTTGGAYNLTWNGGSGNVTAGQTGLFTGTDFNNVAVTNPTFEAGDNVTINRSGTLNISSAGISVGTLTDSNVSGNTTISGGNITMAAFNKTGAGILTIGGNNSSTAGTNITGGVLQMTTGTALGSGSITLNGGTLKPTGTNTTVSNVVIVGASGGTLQNDMDVTYSGQITTINAPINTPNLITKTGTGNITFNKTGTDALGTKMTKDASGGAVELDIQAGRVTLSGSGTRNLAGTSTWDAPVTINGGNLTLHGGAINGNGTISVSADSSISSRLNFSTATVNNSIAVGYGITLGLDSANGNNALAISGIISGDGGLVTKTGNGVVRIEGNNTYTGTTVIAAGTLRVGTGNSGSLGTGNVVAIAPGTLTLNRDDNVTIPNQISGNGTVTGSSTDHTASLTGNNTYTGVTTILSGKLGAPVIKNGGEVSSIGQSTSDAANLVFNGGSLAYEGSVDTSSDRNFTLGTAGGGLSTTGTGALNFTSTSNITMDPTKPVTDTISSVSATASAGALITGTYYQILTLGDTDFTLIGASSNTVGTEFVATGSGTGTGTALSGLTIGKVYRIITPGLTNFSALGSSNNSTNTVFTASGHGFNTGNGTVAYANGTYREFRLGGSGSGRSSVAAAIIDGPANPDGVSFNPNKTSLVKNGNSTWSITGTNSYTGPTTVNAGTLKIDGNNSAATGNITVLGNTAIGGNGVAGGAVTLLSGGGLAAKILNWTGGIAGTDYEDLTVASFNAASVPMNLLVDTSGIINFSEIAKSFTILNTTSGITNFDPANVTVTTQGFSGTGKWSLAKSSNSLVLSYAVTVADPYLAWATGAPYNLSGGNQLGSADPDKDGISNLIEFVVGGNPTAADDSGKLPTLVTSNTQLVLTYRRSDASSTLNPAIQYSTDLATWTTALHGVSGISITSSNDYYGTGIDQVVVSIPKSLGSGAKLFTRLKVSTP